MPDLCYDLQGNVVPCSTEQMGEQYYTAVQSGDPDELMAWWQQNMSYFLEGNENIDTSDPGQMNAWMAQYGQYFAPLSFDEADYSRIQRESGLKRDKLKLEFLEGQPKDELIRGKRGFSGTGGLADVDTSAWDRYSSGLQSIASTQGQSLQDLYGSFGDNFLQLNIALAGMGAFTDDMGDWGAEQETGFSYDEESDYETYSECLQSCYESLGDNLQCAQICLD